VNTLREIGLFVGMAPLGLRAVIGLVPLLTEPQRRSVRAMIEGLLALPPIQLDVRPVGKRFGDVPFAPAFHVDGSGGVVLQTLFVLYAKGPQRDELAVVGESGTFAPITLRLPGIFMYEVRRTGITGNGITTLTRPFHVEGVPPPPPPPPVPSVPPHDIPATTAQRFSRVTLFNCHDHHRALDVHARDLTAGVDYAFVATLGAQYDAQGFCPVGQAVAVPLEAGHWHEIVALDVEMPGCIVDDDPMDPLNANCWREHIVVQGQSADATLQVIVR
jgi:hypothetical protein